MHLKWPIWAGVHMSRTSLKATGEGATGKLVVIRPSKLAEEGASGVVASGTYEGAKPNKFDATKNDYFIRGADDTLYIINETKSLKDQLSQLDGTAGTKIEVEYEGKVKTKNGKGFHNFNVFVVS